MFFYFHFSILKFPSHEKIAMTSQFYLTRFYDFIFRNWNALVLTEVAAQKNIQSSALFICCDGKKSDMYTLITYDPRVEESYTYTNLSN